MAGRRGYVVVDITRTQLRGEWYFVPDVKIRRFCEEGDIVPSESKMLEITGSMAKVLTLSMIVVILMIRPQGLFASKVRR